ncbi:MAG: [FeFe] hydrogenase H-cluster radical SAM maturase HydE [Armatimonadota bacterium]
MTTFSRALNKALDGSELTRRDLIALLSAEGGEVTQLHSAAEDVTLQVFGDEVHLRAVIEFSNHCVRNCLYCGLRTGNRSLARYRMSEEEVLEAAGHAASLGYRTVVLQSGEDPWYTADRLCTIVRKIKARHDVAVTLCIGERPKEEYAALRSAGADRFLLKHETADPELYAALHPGTGLAERVQCLHWLRDCGYQVGSGNIVGLPGQTIEALASDILLMRELGVEMAGIGPFIPHGSTPLAQYPRGSLELTLKVLATARLAMPDCMLPATTAVGTIHPQGRQMALRAGANVVMPNVTPMRFRDKYEIYPGKICVGEDAAHCRGCVEALVRSVGRRVSGGYGHSPRLARPAEAA